MMGRDGVGVDWLPVLANGGASALLFFVVWYVARLIYTGRLVPRSSVEDLRADRDNWRDAHRELAEQNAEMLEAMRSVEQIVRSLQQASQVQRPPRR